MVWKKKKVTHLLVISGFLFCNFSFFGQNSESQPIDLTDLEIPNSPAFMLLDVAPTQIERPTSAKAFAMSILNTVNENNGIPQNYSVEFTPYWYFKHPGLNAFQFWGIDPANNKNKGFSQIKLANISFAYVNKKWEDTISTHNINNIAMGVRGTIFKYISKKNRDDLIEANAQMVKRLSALNDQLSTFDPFEQGFRENVQAFLDGMSTDNELLESEEKIQEILNRKPLLAVDGAAAMNWAFDGNNFSSNQLSLFGAWLTISFAQELNKKNDDEKNYVSVLMLTRYTYDNSIDGNPLANGNYLNLFDLGGKLEFEFKQISFSYEYIFRSVSGPQTNTFRSTAMAKYRVSDKIYLLASLGKNFGDTNNLIAQFGINLGFGTGNEKVFTLEK